MYACICHAVTEDEVKHKAQTSCFAFAHYTTELKCNKSCCKCLPRIKEIINEEKLNKAYSPTHYGGGID